MSRLKLPDNRRREQIWGRVRPDVKAFLDQLAARETDPKNKNAGRAIDRVVDLARPLMVTVPTP